MLLATKLQLHFTNFRRMSRPSDPRPFVYTMSRAEVLSNTIVLALVLPEDESDLVGLVGRAIFCLNWNTFYAICHLSFPTESASVLDLVDLGTSPEVILSELASYIWASRKAASIIIALLWTTQKAACIIITYTTFNQGSRIYEMQIFEEISCY